MSNRKLNDRFSKMDRKAKRKVKEQDEVAIQKPDVSSNDYRLQMTQRKAAAEKEILEQKEWIANGHGEYSTLKSMKDFYCAKMKSKNFVVHVYPIPAKYGEIVDTYLSSIATEHIETKFCKLDGELSQYFCHGLSTKSSTILMYKDSRMIDYIINSDEQGGVGSIENLKFQLAKSAIIFNFGDIYFAPEYFELRRFHHNIAVWIAEVMEEDDSEDITRDRRIVEN